MVFKYGPRTAFGWNFPPPTDGRTGSFKSLRISITELLRRQYGKYVFLLGDWRDKNEYDFSRSHAVAVLIHTYLSLIPPDEGGGETFQVGDRQMLSFVVLFITMILLKQYTLNQQSVQGRLCSRLGISALLVIYPSSPSDWHSSIIAMLLFAH